MLLDLEIKNFALVDHLVLEFGSGLTVLTGETGAGKSVILDSLSFLLGSASAPDGSSSCRVAGRFSPTTAVKEYLEGQGLPVDSEELLIVRERRNAGRTTSRLNGSLVSVSQLKALSSLLVDFHGQHQSYGLTRPSTHLPMLDRMGGTKQAQELQHYGSLYRDYQELLREMEEIRSAERGRLREAEWLRMEIDEIDKVSPADGEELQLELEIKRRAASEELASGTSNALRSLSHEDGALSSVTEALRSVRSLVRFDPQLQPLVERLESQEVELQELLRELTDYSEELTFEPSALDDLQRRVENIKSLCRKYGPTTADVLKHRQEAARKLDRFENSDRVLEELAQKEILLKESLTKSAQKLSKARRKAAGDLGKELVSELSQLAMPKVAFQVEFEALDEFSPSGSERAQFLFSPNPGQPPTPLAETASGGELSRVMLALISILSRFQSQPTLIFDEIDVGLGGRTAEAVAQKLSRLAGRAQVLCVTHLPVVAAAGSGHLVVEKHAKKNKTTVSVHMVEQEERVTELARMLSGDASKKQARELATELLHSIHH